MFAVIVYDIPTDERGKKRYQKIHKLCQKNGYAVNGSVFEFDMDYTEFLKLTRDIEKVIDIDADSVRIYVVGKQRTEQNTRLLGKREVIEVNDIVSVW